MKTATQPAELIYEALEAWGETNDLPISDRRCFAAEMELESAVIAALEAIPGVDAVEAKIGSAGSRYFECFNDAAGVSITFRVSNHKSGRRGNENAGDIVLGESAEEIDRQLARATEAMAQEIADAE